MKNSIFILAFIAFSILTNAQTCPTLPSTIRVGTSCPTSCGNICTTVEVMSLESYVGSGLDNEWSPSWNTESLKAGAVAYRTYGAWFRNAHAGDPNYDIRSDACNQAWRSETTSSCIYAASVTVGEVLVNSSNVIVKAEYSAENNDFDNPNSSCGDGYSGGNGWPCISDNVCIGQAFKGHGKGMCQYGSSRWASQGRNYTWILDHYYNPGNYFRCSRAPINPPICNNDNPCSSMSLSINTNGSCISTSCSTINASPPSSDISFMGGSSCNSLYQVGRYDDDVWFSITPSNSNPINIKVTPTSNASNFDVAIGLYQGSCSNPIQLSCAALNGVGLAENLIYTPTANNTYLIRVFSYGIGSSYSGDFQICVTGTSVLLPNLKITAGTPNADPASVNAGSNLIASCSEDNLGNTTAGSNAVTLWLSNNSILDEGIDTKLGQISFGPVAAQSCSVVLNTTVQIPSNTSSGSYYLFFWADGNKVVSESSDDDNFASTQITITNVSPIITLTPTSLTLASTSNSNGQFNISSNVSWTASADVSWLSLTPTSGSNSRSLTVTTMTENPSTNPRTGIVSITGGGLTRTVSITQNGSPAALSVVQSSVSLGSGSNSSVQININSNVSWSVTDDAAWLTELPSSGSNNGSVALVTLSENPSVVTRSSIVTITGGGISKTVIVTQSGANAALTLSQATLLLQSASNSSGQVNINSNVSWTASDDATWLSITPTSGSNNGTLTITATSAATSSRNGTVTITGSGIAKTVLVTQEGATTTPAIFISTSSLPDFESVPVGGNSNTQTYIISGSNLLSDISITASNGFQFSTNASYNFGTSMILSPSGGVVPNTTIYVRFSPTVTGGQSGNLSHTSSGATTKNISVTGTGGSITKVYQLEYVTGGNQTYGGGGIPNPIVVKVKNITDNVYVTNLIGEGLEIKASSNLGNQDSEFNNFNNYCGNGDNSCYGGSYYVPANSGSAYVLSISVSLRKNNQDISVITLSENITGNLTIPLIVTRSITNLTTNSALSGGNVSTDGGASITYKGVCWSPNLNPTIQNSRSIEGNGNSSFTSNITELTSNTTYHVRAYATNSVGTGYGSDMQFTTLPTAPIIGSINQPTCTQSYGSVVLNGLPSNGTWTLIRTPGGTTMTGTGSSTTVSGLDPGTYTFQVTNAAGSTSGSSASVQINAQLTIPSVTTSAVFDANQYTATSGGNVISEGGSTVTARGVCWSTTSNPTILNSKTSDGLSIGSFTSTITGLTNGVTYHIRAYATNCKGTAYGSDIQYIHNSTGIEDIQGDEVSVFPNPVSGMLNIVYKNDNYETIMILNSQGRLLSKEKVIKPNQQLDFSLYDSGLYILEFIKKTNEVRRIKVIKQ